MPPFLSLIPTLQMGPGKVGVGGLVMGIKVQPESMGGALGRGPPRDQSGPSSLRELVQLWPPAGREADGCPPGRGKT